MDKYCKVCNIALIANPKYSKKQKAKMTYCSKSCQLKSIGKNPDKTSQERFFSKVVKGEYGLCWSWVGSKDKGGYGRINVGGKPMLAHRRSWEMHKSPIPDGYVLRHLCNNPNCVNPDHLAIGSLQDNADDSKKHNRHGFKGGARFSNQEVQLIRISCESGVSYKRIGEIYSINQEQIRKLHKRKTYRSVK